MTLVTHDAESNYWFVDAKGGWESEDVQHFLNASCWVSETASDHVKDVKLGDYIALKNTLSRDADVSAIIVLATGIVIENQGDGRTLGVEWMPLYDKPREWHSRVLSGNDQILKMDEGEWMNDSLIAFAFDEKWHYRNAQDYIKHRYGWTKFYEAVALKLFEHRNDRDDLVAIVHDITQKFFHLPSFLDGEEGKDLEPITDICPFTVMGIFNREMPDKNRHVIAVELARKLGVEEEAPHTFEGIPIYHHENCCVFGSEKNRKDDDIELLWDFFYNALRLCHQDAIEDDKKWFEVAFDRLLGRNNIGWNVTIGLFWIQPWRFLSMDSLTQYYIAGTLNIPISKVPEGNLCKGRVYIELMEELQRRFQSVQSPIHSFPELTTRAWLFQDEDTSANPRSADIDLGELAARDAMKKNSNDMDIYWLEPLMEKANLLQPSGQNAVLADTPSLPIRQPMHQEADEASEKASLEIANIGMSPSYSLESIQEEGCFLPIDTLSLLLERLKTKKNLILQGPPGTGKTWLTKKLAFALVGYKHPECVRTVEFHANMSYEDFIRGWRPAGDGRFALTDGAFVEMINIAKANPSTPIVIIIDEINRGNPTGIFGDMMSLLEADKRDESHAIELSHKKYIGEKFFIPDNLYIIGSMNVADRSLAMIDIALRRRFSFVALTPNFGEKWQQYLHDKYKIPLALLKDVEQRMTQLNEMISEDPELGNQFRVGHSYLTPHKNVKIDDPIKWFTLIAETEIGPLLQEYWFDDRDKAYEALKRLLAGLDNADAN